MRVVFIVQGLNSANLRLQPWRFITQSAIELNKLGVEVNLIVDEKIDLDELEDIKIYQCKSVKKPIWKPNDNLIDLINSLTPDIVFWNVGMTSFFFQNFQMMGIKVVGVFTSPIYEKSEICRLGIQKILSDLNLFSIHIVSSFTPTLVKKFLLKKTGFIGWVVQSAHTKERLQNLGIPSCDINLINPGIDDFWFEPVINSNTEEYRNKIDKESEYFIILYFGGPSSIRGLYDLLDAFEEIFKLKTYTRLVILCRRNSDQLGKDFKKLVSRINNHKAKNAITLIDGFLKKEEVKNWISSVDLVSLPFELIPSDAPISLLEAQCMQKPILTTDVACLSEMVGENGIIIEPGNIQELTREILDYLNVKNNKKIKITPQMKLNNWNEVGKKWLTLINQIMKRR